MNVRQAAEQIEHTVRAYLARDEAGRPLIATQQQRPLLLMGPPGIGKTAVVAQVADRLGLNFVSYSMTHHTRASALGLPYIDEVTYAGVPRQVTRYTMSEIVGATFDARERSGRAEGILFLDEVNCVSETLAPAMLQFLQFKVFGQHALPEGWVVVCAANTAAHNRSARAFDPVTLDRLKRIDIEPDLDAWLAFARDTHVHRSVTSYLTHHPDHFYRLETAGGDVKMVTARAWDDLARMMAALLHEGLPCDEALAGQYLQDDEIASSFAAYLELYLRHEDDYRIGQILAGTADDDVVARARHAPFDERLAVVDLIVGDVVRLTDAAVAHERDLRDEYARLRLAGSDESSLCDRSLALEHEARAALGCASAALAFARDAWGDGDELMVLASRFAHDASLMHLAGQFGLESLVEASCALRFTERTEDLLARLD